MAFGSAKVAADGELSRNIERPYWITAKRLEEIQDQCAKLGSNVLECKKQLRHHNQKLQLNTPSWDRIQAVVRTTSPEEKTNIIGEIISALKKDSTRGDEQIGTDVSAADILYRPGPVGDLPIHQAFLLGQNELGKRLVETFYCRPGIDGEGMRNPSDGSWTFIPRPDGGINTPYVSDLHIWKALVPNVFDDGGLYTGETVLHIAIVQEDLELLDWMLAQGACVTARAKGAFFKPSLAFTENSLQGVTISAHAHGNGIQFFENEDSMCDYGEFPFSFASCVGNVEILKRLARHAEGGGIGKEELIEVLKTQRKIRASLNIRDEIVVSEKGGFMRLLVGLQDSRGNTALHLAVLYDQKESVDWIMAHHGHESLHMLNADGMTPFTLAAHEGNVTMFHHIWDKHMKQVVWRYGSTQLVKFSLLQADSYRTPSSLHRHPKWTSALEIIIQKDIAAFARDPLVEDLVMEKWRKFAKRQYEKKFLAPYLTYLVMYWSTMVCRWQQLAVDGAGAASFAAEVTGSFAGPPGAPGMSLESVDWLAFTSLLLHGFLLVVWMPWLLVCAYRDRHYRHPGESMQGAIFKNLTLILCSSMVVCIILVSAARVATLPEMEKNVWALGSILASLQLLVFIIPFKFFGVLVISLYKMLVNDMAIFVWIYAVLHLAFSLALSLSFVKSPAGIMPAHADFATRFPAMMLYQFWTGMDNLAMEELEGFARSLQATQTLHLTFVVLFNVLGLNLIIAMMGKTFTTDMEDVHRLWLFPFATLVLHLERNLSDAQRKNCEAFRCGTDPGDADTGLPKLQEHDADLDEQEVAPRSSWLPFGAPRRRVTRDRVESCAWVREFYLERLEEVPMEAGKSSVASTSGGEDIVCGSARGESGGGFADLPASQRDTDVMEGLLRWWDDDMRQKLASSREKFCREVDQRLDRVAARQLVPVQTRAAAGMSPMPSSIDTSQVWPSVLGSAGSAAASTAAAGVCGGQGKPPVPFSGQGTLGAESTAQAPRARASRSLRGISPLPGSRQASEPHSREDRASSAGSAPARPPSASAVYAAPSRQQDALPVEGGGMAQAHAEGSGQEHRQQNAQLEAHPLAPMPSKLPQARPEQLRQAALADLSIPPACAQEQQRQQYARDMEMLSLAELGLEAIDRGAGSRRRGRAGGPAPSAVFDHHPGEKGTPPLLELEAGRQNGDRQCHAQPRDGGVVPGATPPQSEGRVSSAASAGFKAEPQAAVDQSGLSPELAAVRHEAGDADADADAGNQSINNQSAVSWASNMSQHQRSPPRPTTRLVPSQPQPQRASGTSPRKRVPETKALVLDPQQQQAMKAGFALDSADRAAIRMVPPAADAALASAEPPAYGDGGRSELPAAPTASAAAAHPVVATWNIDGELTAAPSVRLPPASSSLPPRTLASEVNPSRSGKTQLQALEAVALNDMPEMSEAPASRSLSSDGDAHAVSHPRPDAARPQVAAQAPAEASTTSGTESAIDTGPNRPDSGAKEGPAEAGEEEEAAAHPAASEQGEASASRGSETVGGAAGKAKAKGKRPVLKPLAQAKSHVTQGVADRPQVTQEEDLRNPLPAAGGLPAQSRAASVATPVQRTRTKEMRPGFKKIYVQQVVEGGVMDVEEWVPCDVSEIFKDVRQGADEMINTSGGNFGSAAKGLSATEFLSPAAQATAASASAGWGLDTLQVANEQALKAGDLKRLPADGRQA